MTSDTKWILAAIVLVGGCHANGTRWTIEQMEAKHHHTNAVAAASAPIAARRAEIEMAAALGDWFCEDPTFSRKIDEAMAIPAAHARFIRFTETNVQWAAYMRQAGGKIPKNSAAASLLTNSR